jgi:hypothetical protein
VTGMSEPPRYDTRYDDPSAIAMKQQLLENELYDASLAPMPEAAPVKRERVFPRKVLIGWALATAAAYFGVQIAKVAIREAFKQAAVYTTGVETTPDNREVIYTTPNGKLIITKNRETGQIVIKKARNGHEIVIGRPAPTAPPAPVAPPAPATSGPVLAPAKPPTPEPPAKR